MADPIVDAQETVEPDELLAALEASHGGTKATEDDEPTDKGKSDGNPDEEEDKETPGEGEDEDSEEDGKGSGQGDKAGSEEEETTESEEESPDPSLAAMEEMREIKSLLRQTLRQNKILEAKIGRLESKKPAKEEYDEDGNLITPDKEEEEELSTVEVLQQALDSIQEARGDSFEMMVEIMRNSKEYGDVDEVCTQGNFDDIIEAVAAQLSAEKGIDPTEAYLQASIGVWNKPNPFKYAYGLIKKYHPAFSSSEDETKKKTGKKKTAKDVVKEAPGSVADLGGGGASKGTWTAEKIDALPESELSKVPKAVYDKYLAGELD